MYCITDQSMGRLCMYNRLILWVMCKRPEYAVCTKDQSYACYKEKKTYDPIRRSISRHLFIHCINLHMDQLYACTAGPCVN